jgi:hypothetical protein
MASTRPTGQPTARGGSSRSSTPPTGRTKAAGAHVAPLVHDALEIRRLCPKTAQHQRPTERPKPYLLAGADETNMPWLSYERLMHVTADADGSSDGSSERSPLTRL